MKIDKINEVINVKIPKNILKYLNDNEWTIVYNGENMAHYYKMAHNSIHHLYIQYFPQYNEYEVELGVGDTQNDSETFKLRNIVSVLKKRNL